MQKWIDAVSCDMMFLHLPAHDMSLLDLPVGVSIANYLFALTSLPQLSSAHIYEILFKVNPGAVPDTISETAGSCLVMMVSFANAASLAVGRSNCTSATRHGIILFMMSSLD